MAQPREIDRNELKPRLERAFDFAADQVRATVVRGPDFFPIYTSGGHWSHPGESWTEWCAGFHTGVMWLFAQRTGDEIVVCGQFFHTGTPVVLCMWERPDDPPDLPCVAVDFSLAGSLAAQHLLELGHTRVGALVGSKSHDQDKWPCGIHGARRDGFVAVRFPA